MSELADNLPGAGFASSQQVVELRAHVDALAGLEDDGLLEVVGSCQLKSYRGTSSKVVRVPSSATRSKRKRLAGMCGINEVVTHGPFDEAVAVSTCPDALAGTSKLRLLMPAVRTTRSGRHAGSVDASDAHRGAVATRFAVGGVVQLEHEDGARLEQARLPIGIGRRIRTRRPRGEEAAPLVEQVPAHEPPAVERLRRQGVGEDVDHVDGTGLLDRLDPGVLFEVHGDREVLVADATVRRDVEALGIA